MGLPARAASRTLVDSTTSYLAQMGAEPLLSEARELQLARRIERGDRRVLVALLHDRGAVDELLRVAAAGTTTRALAAEVLLDVDPRHADFDEAARRRELTDVLAALRRYRDAQERGVQVGRARELVLERLSQQWFRSRVLAAAVATLADGSGEPRTYRRALDGMRVADGARADLLRGNLRLVVGLARAYRSRAVELLDLVQEGNIGLMKAIDRFDYRRGYRLATYATWWIRNAVSRAVAETPRTIRVPANMRRAVSRVAHAKSRLTRTLGRAPAEDEIARDCGVSLERLRIVGAVPARPLSLETPIGAEDGKTLQDLLTDRQAASPAQSLCAAELAGSVQSALSVLSEREARVVRLRFGLGKPDEETLEQIGRHFGVSRQRIRQIEERALTKLRRRAVAGSLQLHLES